MHDDVIPTRERILTAARVLILAGGRAGLRIDAVAQRAGINKRMIYHHFGDKAGLAAAVYEEANAALLREDVAFTDSARLVLWQALEGGLNEEALDAIGHLSADALRDSVAGGSLRAVRLACRLVHPVLSELLEHVTGEDLSGWPDDLDSVADQLSRAGGRKPRVRLKPEVAVVA
ncbi:MAG: TetR/AcrR family transcriptional regulator [Pseudomonadales bacterium]|jgi:AcrR family transcriptional regulator|nr:TetR/AcrR family transcriptional regulator [Pseudomonadales bacterium]